MDTLSAYNRKLDAFLLLVLLRTQFITFFVSFLIGPFQAFEIIISRSFFSYILKTCKCLSLTFCSWVCKIYDDNEWKENRTKHGLLASSKSKNRHVTITTYSWREQV